MVSRNQLCCYFSADAVPSSVDAELPIVNTIATAMVCFYNGNQIAS